MDTRHGPISAYIVNVCFQEILDYFTNFFKTLKANVSNVDTS